MVSIAGINSLSTNLGPEPLILPGMKLMTQMKSTFNPTMAFWPQAVLCIIFHYLHNNWRRPTYTMNNSKMMNMKMMNHNSKKKHPKNGCCCVA